MAGPLMPVIIGGQIISMAAPTAMTLLRSGAARALPRMRDVGSQTAGPNAAGPFFGRGSANLPSLLDRPGLLGRGAAGLGAAGMVASGSGVPEREPMRGRMAPIMSAPMNASDLEGPSEYIRQAPIMSAPMSAADLEGPSEYVQQAPIMSRPMSAAELDGPSTYRRAPRLEDAPVPPRRPETPAADSILRRIFSGQDYQSNSRPVVEDKRVNWGDPDRAADFFRADRAARELGTLPPVERASGGQVGQAGQSKMHKDAALVKALEIIERLMSNGR